MLTKIWLVNQVRGGKMSRSFKNRRKLWMRSPRRKKQTSPLTEDPEEQRHIENTLSNCLNWKVKLQGRQQCRASNEMTKYLGRWLPPPHLMPCTNWICCIYEEKIPKQRFHNSQPSLPTLEGSGWDKHPNGSPKMYRWRAKMQWGTIKGKKSHRNRGCTFDTRNRERKRKLNLIVKVSTVIFNEQLLIGLVRGRFYA